MLFVWYKVSFDEKWSHGSAVCETVYFFVEFVCVFPWKCVSLNNQNREKIMDGILRKLPIGIQTFEGIRKDNYLYVDKTALVWRMANLGKPYFLSRPRRFGKSLLISTFDAYFQGKKELFDGLAIEQLETKWEQHPVLHLDLNAKKYETAADLIAMLNQYLEKWEAIYGNEKKDRSPEERFSYVIEQASLKTGKGVVVWVDEYDKALLQAMNRPKLFEVIRQTLKAIFEVR